MNEYLNDLLSRMLDKNECLNSSESVSYQAHREADKLADISFIPQLIEFVDREKDKNKRNNAYFILGKIAKNTADIGATNYLISRIDKETDKYILSWLLDRICDLQKSKETNIQPIINAINNKSWQVKSSAILALKHTDNPLAEDALIDVLKNPKTSEFDLTYANSTLAGIGTEKSIPYLIKLTTHKKIDVTGTALGAIITISDETCLPLCLERLEKGKNKTTALEGVVKFGNENVVSNVIKRIKELVAKPRQIHIIVGKDGKTELIVGLEFLLKYPENLDVKKAFELLRTKKYDLLWKEEKEWLEKNASH